MVKIIYSDIKSILFLLRFRYYKIVKETGNEEIDNKASIDYVNWIDYKVYTVKDLIDRIEKCM